MASIFINYRRDDSSGWVGHLSQDLHAAFGDDEVFEDIADIEPGTDFTEAIEKKLDSVNVLLAVIGPRWVAAADKKTGRRRLDDPDDLVRKEIATALRRGIRVVPVLVGGASLPSAEELPDDLKGLLRRNACELSDTRWDYDVRQLILRLKPARTAHFGTALADLVWSSSKGARRGYALASLAVIALLAVVGIFGWNGQFLSARAHLASLRLSIIDDRLERARPAYSYLEEQGAALSFIGTTELAKLQMSRPDMVIVGASTRWARNDPITLKQTFEGYKVVGLGNAGDELFRLLGLQISGVMHAHEGNLVVEEPALLTQPVTIAAPDRSVDIFKTQVEGDAVGVYDGGSPDIAGFEGLARWQSSKNHWPIARQGNFLFWGFEASSSQMSDSGKALMINVVANHKSQPWTPLSKLSEQSEARRKLERISPGIVTGQLTAQVPLSVRLFSIKKPGPIEATLTWNSGDCPLSLILNGPGQVGYFARKDGASPLSLDFVVTEQQIAKGSDWSIRITCFRELGPEPLTFTLKVIFPDSS
jgi:type II secretory pathway pseudopilin PulG